MVAWITAAAWAAEPSGPREEWAALVATGCDLAKAEVETPLEARVLRNTPYALAGHRFQSAALTAFFTADGDWYRPRDAEAPLDAAALACVQKIAALEPALQRQAPMSDGLVDRMLRDPRVFRTLRMWSRLPGPTYAEVHASHDPDGTWTWASGIPGCPGGHAADGTECGGYGVRCGPEGEPCDTVASG
ncbi:MAG: YARHG domain-containing protein [Myxococcota bacterium]